MQYWSTQLLSSLVCKFSWKHWIMMSSSVTQCNAPDGLTLDRRSLCPHRSAPPRHFLPSCCPRKAASWCVDGGESCPSLPWRKRGGVEDCSNPEQSFFTSEQNKAPTLPDPCCILISRKWTDKCLQEWNTECYWTQVNYRNVSDVLRWKQKLLNWHGVTDELLQDG